MYCGHECNLHVCIATMIGLWPYRHLGSGTITILTQFTSHSDVFALTVVAYVSRETWRVESLILQVLVVAKEVFHGYEKCMLRRCYGCPIPTIFFELVLETRCELGCIHIQELLIWKKGSSNTYPLWHCCTVRVAARQVCLTSDFSFYCIRALKMFIHALQFTPLLSYLLCLSSFTNSLPLLSLFTPTFTMIILRQFLVTWFTTCALV